MLEAMNNKICGIEQLVKMLAELLLQQTNGLTTYKSVGIFLGKHPKTIKSYIKSGKLRQGKHYVVNEDGKTVFIPQGIMEYKHGLSTTAQVTIDMNLDNERVNHSVVTNMLKGIA